MTWLKMTFNAAHIVALFPYVLGVAFEVYAHSSIFGNPSPVPVTGVMVTSWVMLTSAYFTALFTRSPQDAWRLITGTLLPAVVQDVTGQPAASPPAARRGFARIGVILVASALALVSVILAACLNTPTKVSTAVNLATTVECVYTKLDANESPEQAASDCGVTVDDVFKLVSLFDRRAAAKGLLPKDAGAR